MTNISFGLVFEDTFQNLNKKQFEKMKSNPWNDEKAWQNLFFFSICLTFYSVYESIFVFFILMRIVIENLQGGWQWGMLRVYRSPFTIEMYTHPMKK